MRRCVEHANWCKENSNQMLTACPLFVFFLPGERVHGIAIQRVLSGGRPTMPRCLSSIAAVLAYVTVAHAACNTPYAVPDHNQKCGNNFVQARKEKNACCTNGYDLATITSQDCFEEIAAMAIVKMNAQSSTSSRTLMLSGITGVASTDGSTNSGGDVTMVSSTRTPSLAHATVFTPVTLADGWRRD